MSRPISISYRNPTDDFNTSIEIRAPYFLFGTQRTSEKFWALPLWRSLGVTRLSELGHLDPIYFSGWDMLDVLAKEIRTFQDHFSEIEFEPDVKSCFLAHLVYCHSLLIETAPRNSIPEMTIG